MLTRWRARLGGVCVCVCVYVCVCVCAVVLGPIRLLLGRGCGTVLSSDGGHRLHGLSCAGHDAAANQQGTSRLSLSLSLRSLIFLYVSPRLSRFIR
jgi:hypothetical protein